MASALKNLSDYDPNNIPNAEAMSFGIVVSEYHQHITFALKDGCIETLLKHGAKEENIYIEYVPGAYEMPIGAKIIADQQKLDAVITLGCVIKGETDHDKYINQSVASALMNLNLVKGIPFVFGLLTPNTEEQAKERAGGKHGNKGVEAAITAIKMAAKLIKPKKKLGF